MGFFDRFFTPRQATPATPQHAAQPEPESGNSGVASLEQAPVPAGSVKPLLKEARDHLDAKNAQAALAIYERILGEGSGTGEAGGAGSVAARADVLVTISGDLGSTGHLREITELVGPRYDAQKHGPATGLNLLQAYIALRNVDAAQHILDLLFGLGRPELEDRLHGFSNAIAELIAQGQFAPTAPVSPSVGPEGTASPDAAPTTASASGQVHLVTISKPIWSYGLEDALGELFPVRDAAKGVRRVAFAQLALPGLDEAAKPEDELGRLSRAIPLWLAETFSYSPLYAPVAAIGVQHSPGNPGHYALFPSEWTTDNLRQLVDSARGEAGGAGGLDYIFTGSLQEKNGDVTLTLRVWEVRKFRERKKVVLRWTPATADAELAKLHAYLRQFMEWRDGSAGEPVAASLRYAPPGKPLRWLHTLGTSLTLFLAGKDVLARDQIPPVEPVLRDALDSRAPLLGTNRTDSQNDAPAQTAPDNTAAILAALTLLARARDLGAIDETALADLVQTLDAATNSAPTGSEQSNQSTIAAARHALGL